MKSRSLPIKYSLAILLATSVTLPAQAAGLRPFSADDLVRLERVSDPQLSANERYVAYQLRETDWDANKGRNSIWLIDLSQKPVEPRRLTGADVESNTPRWSSDGRLYFFSTRSGSQQVWRMAVEGGAAQAVTKLPLDVGAYAIAPDGKALALSMEVFTDCDSLACSRQRLDAQQARKASGQLYDRLFIRHWDTWKNGSRAQLYYARLGTDGTVNAEPSLLSRGIDGDVPTKPFGGDEEFTFTPNGRHVIFTARIAGETEAWSTNTDLWLVPVDGTTAPRNLTPDGPGYDTGPAVSPDGKTLAYLSMRRAGYEADRYRILLKDLATGETRELQDKWDASPGALQWSPDGRRIYATADELGQTPLFSSDLRGNLKTHAAVGSVAGYSVGKHFVIYAQDTLGSPAQLYSVAPNGGKVTALTHHGKERMAEVALGDYEQFKFVGWNDETVHGYVMKPAGYEAGKKYPVAFIVHGGPQSSMGNHWHYRWNPQTYAGRGYAVVFIDFHGSTGYGQRFTESISGDWGGKPLVDLQKGWAHALKTYDFLDGDRACALGASYGGYMMNWIAGNWPDAFKCLVNHDGIFDNRAMAYTTEELWFDEWEFGGTPYEKPELYEKHNPVNQVANWKTPMLVVHGGLDYRIPDSQGIATFTALQRRGIQSQLLFFPNENHWVLKPQNSVQWHNTVNDWLARWLK